MIPISFQYDHPNTASSLSCNSNSFLGNYINPQHKSTPWHSDPSAHRTHNTWNHCGIVNHWIPNNEQIQSVVIALLINLFNHLDLLLQLSFSRQNLEVTSFKTVSRSSGNPPSKQQPWAGPARPAHHGSCSNPCPCQSLTHRATIEDEASRITIIQK